MMKKMTAFALPPTTNLVDKIAAIIASVSTTAVITTTAMTMAVTPVHALGVNQDLLTECIPPRICCISSQDDAPVSFLEPWQYDRSNTTRKELLEMMTSLILSSSEEVIINQKSSDYVHFEISIPFIKGGGIDDVEFYFPVNDDIIHFRSEARNKKFDGWRNRKRLEKFRVQLGLTSVPVLRGRSSMLGVFESPFDSFGPSVVDVDAVIEHGGVTSRPMR